MYRIHWRSKRHGVPLSPMDVRMSRLLPLGDQNTFVVCMLLEPGQCDDQAILWTSSTGLSHFRDQLEESIIEKVNRQLMLSFS